jgi:hypothetical protein
MCTGRRRLNPLAIFITIIILLLAGASPAGPGGSPRVRVLARVTVK